MVTLYQDKTLLMFRLVSYNFIHGNNHNVFSVATGDCLGKIEGIHSQALTKVLFRVKGSSV